MAEETVVVGRKSQYGFKVGNTWYNVDAPLKSDDFTEGQHVTIETYTGRKGGTRVAKILGQNTTTTNAVVKDAYQANQHAKNEQIRRQGCIQASVRAVQNFSEDVEVLFKNAEALANKMIAFIENK